MPELLIFKIMIEISAYWLLFIVCTRDIFNYITNAGGRLIYLFVLLIIANLTLIMRAVFWNVIRSQILKK